MSITPGKWLALGGGRVDAPDGMVASTLNQAGASPYRSVQEISANARAIAEIPNMIDLLRKLEQKALHMHYASEDAGAILKRIED